ncbi:uncharacterized protein SPPG_03905 [Spizellomyces punctatus DAOM BR117]|uniref:Uncharacterized protein n=1 Tax=Spizellomyces punctatus (strain DAOM BR117) TaxID=645134 RepID=A0A0L0HIA6_SPIPD|nr:uncharacterized protein SPPG_03905 [Spizellomyces punctatus DAOM BR117]KND00793.1 hypothetical protein SPPG_03905 [Spizellomyces punctatus DAOM BR117]|eukprot:XP_016608832.1 hypothetical protein SPPG_03905 [Spizellomyces punctatus DAOM BR117]
MARKTISPKPSTPSASRTDGDLTREASTPTSTRLCTRRSYAAQGITPVVQKRWGGPTIISYKSLPTTPSTTLEERSPAQKSSTTRSQPSPNLTAKGKSTTKREQSKRQLKRKSEVRPQDAGDKEETGGKKPRTTKSKTLDSRTKEKQSTLQKTASKEPLEDRFTTTWRTQEETMRKQIEQVVNGGSQDIATEDTKPDPGNPFDEEENGADAGDAATTGLNDESEPEETRKIPLGEALQLLHRDSLERLLRYAIVEEVVLKPTDIAEELEATGVLQ